MRACVRDVGLVYLVRGKCVRSVKGAVRCARFDISDRVAGRCACVLVLLLLLVCVCAYMSGLFVWGCWAVQTKTCGRKLARRTKATFVVHDVSVFFMLAFNGYTPIQNVLLVGICFDDQENLTEKESYNTNCFNCSFFSLQVSRCERRKGVLCRS